MELKGIGQIAGYLKVSLETVPLLFKIGIPLQIEANRMMTA